MRRISEKELDSKKLYIRNTIFGVEDSLVSTVGLLSGVAVAGVPTETIVITGVILIFVEALSMGVGSYLSEQSVQEFALHRDGWKASVVGGTIMFFSYFLSGFIPLFPYIILESSSAFYYSILASFIFLFILGVVSARLFNAKMFTSGLRMLIVGGLAIAIGVFIGGLVR